MTDIIFLLCSFAGGIFGAAFGGVTVFFLCGLSVIIGSIITYITGDYTFNNIVTWGPFLGPHVTFCGAVAAAAYAGKKKKINSGRNVLIPLFGISCPLTLLVGGIFGLAGFLLNGIFRSFPLIKGLPFTDTISLTVIICGSLSQILFYKTTLVKTNIVSELSGTSELISNWNPWSLPPLQLLIIAISISILSSNISIQLPGLTELVFGFCAVSLILLQFNAKIPVIHHIALCSAFVAGKTGSIWLGITAGLLAAGIAEIFARTVLAKSSSHIDPPAFSITIIYFIFNVLKLSGIL